MHHPYGDNEQGFLEETTGFRGRYEVPQPAAAAAAAAPRPSSGLCASSKSNEQSTQQIHHLCLFYSSYCRLLVACAVYRRSLPLSCSSRECRLARRSSPLLGHPDSSEPQCRARRTISSRSCCCCCCTGSSVCAQNHPIGTLLRLIIRFSCCLCRFCFPLATHLPWSSRSCLFATFFSHFNCWQPSASTAPTATAATVRRRRRRRRAR